MQLIRRNLGWLLVSQLSTWGLSIALLLIVPHKLGDEAYGQLSFAMIYVGFFELVAIFGTATFIMKVVARDEDAVGPYIVNAFLLKVVFALVMVACAIGLALVLGFDSEMLVLVAIVCLGMFLNTISNGFMGALGGLQRLRGPALADVMRAYASGVVGLIILYAGGTLWMLALAGALSNVIPLIACVRLLRPHLRGNYRRIDTKVLRGILAGGVPFFLWAALSQFYITIDIPLLHWLSNDETVGWYALAYRWVSMPIFFANVVGNAFLPALAVDGQALTDSFKHLANRALKLVMIVSTPAAVGMILIAPDFLNLVYGGEFDKAAPIMQVLALQLPIIALDIVLGSVVIAADRQRQWVYVGLVAAIFNPLLNLVAIPMSDSMFGNAAIGAAAVTVLTEIILLVGALVLRPAGVLDRASTGVFVRITVASLAMVPVILALGPLPLPVRVAAGIVTYGIASLALRTTTVREVQSLAFGSVRRERASATVSPSQA